MTKLQVIRAFTSFVLAEKVIIARDKFDDTNFAMDIANPQPRLKLPKNLNFKYDITDKQFRKNFVERCPLAQGFSNIILTLLHECGHWATRSVMNIIFAITPFQITYFIVLWVLVFVINLWEIVRIGDKCQSNNSMHKKAFSLSSLM